MGTLSPVAERDISTGGALPVGALPGGALGGALPGGGPLPAPFPESALAVI